MSRQSPVRSPQSTVDPWRAPTEAAGVGGNAAAVPGHHSPGARIASVRGTYPFLLILVLGGAAALAAQEPALQDRILAVVDEDPILLSDVRRVIDLGLVERRDGESDEALRYRALEGLVEQKLRYHEVTRYGFERVPLDLVDRQLEALEERWGGFDALEARLEDLSMTRAALRQQLARQIEIMTYVEELLGARVFVGLEEIEAYYEQELAPAMEGRGETPPPIASVREQIREVLRQRKLNEELERWTEELRLEADVVLHLEPSEPPLPPVVETIPSAAALKQD